VAEGSPIIPLRPSFSRSVEQELSGMETGLKPELQRKIMSLFIGEVRS
jgi:hypothetical protein